jgi:hypothetical protein
MVHPSLSNTPSRRSRRSSGRTTKNGLIVVLPLLLIAIGLVVVSPLLLIARIPLQIDLVSAREGVEVPLSTQTTQTVAAPFPTSSSTSWRVGLFDMMREAPNLGKWQSPQARAVAESLLPAWIVDIGVRHEKKIFSQYGEDGIVQYILQHLPSPATLKTYVEFGVETGIECNTRYLREQHNWSGLMLDGGTDRPEIGLHQEMIHPDNIVSLFEKYGVQKKFGLFSEDTDYADFFIWRNVLDAGYRPRILIGEINSNLFADESVTAHDPGRDVRMWTGGGSDYYGVSALALRRLWNTHGYIMVYCTGAQINCFGLHQDDILLPNDRNPAGLKAAQEALWAKPLVWPRKMHKCDMTFETWSYVDENGDLAEGVEFTPRVTEFCHEEEAWENSQMQSPISAS